MTFFLLMEDMNIVLRSLLICGISRLPIPRRYMQFQKMNPTFLYQPRLQVTHLVCGHHLHDEYIYLGKLLAEYKNEIILYLRLVANILVFKYKANSILRFQKLEDEGNLQAITKENCIIINNY